MTSESGWLHSNQKGKEVGEIGTVYCLRGQQLLPAKSGYLTQHYSPLETWDSDSQEKPMAVGGREVGKSEGRSVMGRIGV